MTPTEQVLDRLRAALEARAREVHVSGDAWQRNQRRLAADRSHRRRTLFGTAAVVLAVAAVLGAGGLLGADGSGGPPADGQDDASGDPFAGVYILGEPVDAETLTVDGQRTVHQIVLTDMTGQGPNLCDRYVAGTSSSGSCASRDPAADAEGVAFDWLSGTSGGGDLRGVLGGVDERVAEVRIWLDDGGFVMPELHRTGWEGQRMFARTTMAGDPIAQRLTAFARDGAVLQSVDLPARLGGGDWLPARSACTVDGGATGFWPVPESGGPDDVTVVLGTDDALVTVAGAPPVCLDHLGTGPIAGVASIGDAKVAVLAPEVSLVRVVDGDRKLDLQMVAPARGTPWGVSVVRGLDADVLARAELMAMDKYGLELGRRALAPPAAP